MEAGLIVSEPGGPWESQGVLPYMGPLQDSLSYGSLKIGTFAEASCDSSEGPIFSRLTQTPKSDP